MERPDQYTKERGIPLGMLCAEAGVGCPPSAAHIPVWGISADSRRIQKGYLFNNAYIYASKRERETMNKAPHYKQSGVVFTLAGGIFTVNAIDCIAQTDWLFLVSIALVIVALTYAVLSSIIIEKRKK